MNKNLNYIGKGNFNKKIILTGSKSESNRLLILQQLFPSLQLDNVSNAKDTVVLQKALSSNKKTIDIGHAGTAMRFLTAYFACKENSSVILTGSERMQQRPIKILVDALRVLGADISYLNQVGYPPLKIIGTAFSTHKVQINGNISSQYITALLLIAPSLPKGLILNLKGNITSKPYIDMTLALLQQIGVKTTWVDDTITVQAIHKITSQTVTIESDWSAASYFYSLVALSKNGTLSLSNFKKNSIQGDKALAAIYKKLGVTTIFKNNCIELLKTADFKQKKHVRFNLIETPDIAQTIAVTCFGLGVSCGLTGLHTLKIKETDRLEALKIELKKLGAKVRITEDSLHLASEKRQEVRGKNQEVRGKNQEVRSKKQDERGKMKEARSKNQEIDFQTQNAKFKIQNILIETYDDHRMAMAFAPLALLQDITIKEANVVVKSYPNFWVDLDGIFG